MDEEWVTDIRDQCAEGNVLLFFKQWGGTNKKKTGRSLEGRIWSQMPDGVIIVG
jgi:protein gp37